MDVGMSDFKFTPAWIVAEANTYARIMGKTPFVIYQGAWSVLQRDFERDIIPMARHLGWFSLTLTCRSELTVHRQLGVALAPWTVLAGGKIRTDAEEERRLVTGEKGMYHSRPFGAIAQSSPCRSHATQ